MDGVPLVARCAAVRATGKRVVTADCGVYPRMIGCAHDQHLAVTLEPRGFTCFHPSIAPADMDHNGPCVSFPARESLLHSILMIVPAFSGVTFSFLFLPSTIRSARLIGVIPSRAMAACRGPQGAQRRATHAIKARDASTLGSVVIRQRQRQRHQRSSIGAIRQAS